jgi:DnaJ-class molecular chaperone
MYRRTFCYKCGGKLATDMMGREWCPRCVGREMGEKVSKKLNLNLDKGGK